MKISLFLNPNKFYNWAVYIDKFLESITALAENRHGICWPIEDLRQDANSLLPLGLSVFPHNPGLLYLLGWIYAHKQEYYCSLEYLHAASQFMEYAFGRVVVLFESGVLHQNIEYVKSKLDGTEQKKILSKSTINILEFSCYPFSHQRDNVGDSGRSVSDSNRRNEETEMHFYDRDSGRYDDDSAEPERRAREHDEQKESACIDDTSDQKCVSTIPLFLTSTWFYSFAFFQMIATELSTESTDGYTHTSFSTELYALLSEAINRANFNGIPIANSHLAGHETSQLRLHLGCQNYQRCPRVGWLVMDASPSVSVHFVGAVTDLKPIISRNHTVDFLYASHVLEHLSQSHACEVCQALREWRRVLKHDGVRACHIARVGFRLWSSVIGTVSG